MIFEIPSLFIYFNVFPFTLCSIVITALLKPLSDNLST